MLKDFRTHYINPKKYLKANMPSDKEMVTQILEDMPNWKKMSPKAQSHMLDMLIPRMYIAREQLVRAIMGNFGQEILKATAGLPTLPPNELASQLDYLLTAGLISVALDANKDE